MMRVSSPSTHDVPGSAGAPAVIGGALPRASGADAARTIIGDGGVATLSTLAREPAGFPFGSVVSYATDAEGTPTFFISELAEHTRNLRADHRASVLITESCADGVDPLALGRVTLIGSARPVPDAEQTAARELVVAQHPTIAGYATYGDFSCWRLAVGAVRWVGGFGRMDWIDVDAYRTATIDQVVVDRHQVIEHMNADHADAGVLLCQEAVSQASPGSTVNKATFEHVDRFGCDYLAATDHGTVAIRLAFDEPALTLTDVRAAVVTLVRRARAS